MKILFYTQRKRSFGDDRMRIRLCESILLCLLFTLSSSTPLDSAKIEISSVLPTLTMVKNEHKVTTQKTQSDEVSYTLISSSASQSPVSSSSEIPLNSAFEVTSKITENTQVSEKTTPSTVKPSRTRTTRTTKASGSTSSNRPTVVRVKPESKNSASKISAISDDTKYKNKVIKPFIANTTDLTPEFKPEPEIKHNVSVEIPLSRKNWLKLIENEMLSYEKKTGNSPISNKNLTLISNRILKFLVENGTTVGIDLREDKAKQVIIYHKNNSVTSTGNKVYGDGTESKFPPILEFVVTRIQSFFSVYAHNDTSRPLPWEQSTQQELNATLREEEVDSAESSTLTGQDIVDQIEEELSEYISLNDKNVTSIKLPLLIKAAYDKFTSWLVPSKPNAKEEPSNEDGTSEGDKKKPSLFTTAVEAIETIWSALDDTDTSDEETTEDVPVEKDDGAEMKETPDEDIEKFATIKETVSENIMDFLNLAYTLYEAS